MCFTFHSEEIQKNLGHSLNTTSTGTVGGLWLRMNVEQTEEYFFGPENSAGFKVRIIFSGLKTHLLTHYHLASKILATRIL